MRQGGTMKKMWRFLIIVTAITGVLWLSIPRRPRLVSSITSGDTAYLTVMVDVNEAEDAEKLEAKLWEMYRADSFSGIKLQAEGKAEAKYCCMKVYRGKKALEDGKEYLMFYTCREEDNGQQK